MGEALRPEEKFSLEGEYQADKNTAGTIEDIRDRALQRQEEELPEHRDAVAKSDESRILRTEELRDVNSARAKEFVDERLDRVQEQAARDMEAETGERPNLDQDK